MPADPPGRMPVAWALSLGGPTVRHDAFPAGRPPPTVWDVALAPRSSAPRSSAPRSSTTFLFPHRYLPTPARVLTETPVSPVPARTLGLVLSPPTPPPRPVRLSVQVRVPPPAVHGQSELGHQPIGERRPCQPGQPDRLIRTPDLDPGTRL